jgi:polyhydroxyalkanoate synthesis regulator phasin
MSEEPKGSDQRGLSEALRAAIERTFAASADSAAETRERAQELLDEVTRRGREAREAVEGMRLTSRDELRSLEKRLEELSARVEALEAKSKVEG